MNFLERGCHCLSQTFHLPCLIRLNGCKSNREESVLGGVEGESRGRTHNPVLYAGAGEPKSLVWSFGGQQMAHAPHKKVNFRRPALVIGSYHKS